MPRIEHDRAAAAFDAGYHSERLEGANHTVHSLRADAEAIVQNLPGEGVDVEYVRDALLYGIEIDRYEDADSVLGHLADAGDTIVIWTLGDRQAQVAKVRNAGWEAAIRNPHDMKNFRIIAGQDKLQYLPMIAEFSSNKRSNMTLFVLDDRLENLTGAQQVLSEQEDMGMRVHYVWMNRRDGRVADDASRIHTVSSLTEYETFVATKRGEGERVTHAIDLDSTLIDADGSRESRKRAVVDALAHGRTYARIGRPVFRQLNGLHIIDHEDVLPRIHEYDVVHPDFAGHQAHIYETNNHLVKVFARERKQRPDSTDWQSMGGYRGAHSLAATMNGYRQRLQAVGFPVPDSTFMVGRDVDGSFVPIELVPKLGESLQDIFIHGSREERLTAAKAILTVSRPLLLADGIGADIKPANFVYDTDGALVHIDPLPVIMVDEHNTVITEWPPITSPEIAGFLYDTHMTPLSIGYRYYQELCQLDVANRSAYQDVIRTTVSAWVRDGELQEEQAYGIMEAVQPIESRILHGVLDGARPWTEGIEEIRRRIAGYDADGKHPIYTLREMGFLLSERLIADAIDTEHVVDEGLQIIEDVLGQDVRTKIAAAVSAVPPDLRFLTVIRKLTHLSHADYRAGREEDTALAVIAAVSKGIVEHAYQAKAA